MDMEFETAIETPAKLLRYADVEREFGLNRNTLYALVHQGRIPHVRFGPRFVRFRRSDLEQWIASNSIGSEGTR